MLGGIYYKRRKPSIYVIMTIVSFLALLVTVVLFWASMENIKECEAKEAITQTFTVSVSIKPRVLSARERVAEIISEVARQEGFKDKDLLIRIAKAESSLNAGIRGRVDSRDRGTFQINAYWNPQVSDECAFCVWCSTRWAISEVNNGNLWKWNASRHNWNK